MAARLRFVDSIASSPTVRLDLNDRSSLYIESFDCPPPPLDRATVASPFSDGATPVTAQYRNRTLTITLVVSAAASADAQIAVLRGLHRELDRARNIIEWRREGATSSVFFRTFAAGSYDNRVPLFGDRTGPITLTIEADPYALGLKQTLSPVTLTNDPATTPGQVLTVSNVLGDVLTPAILSLDPSSVATVTIGTRHRGDPSGVGPAVPLPVSAATLYSGTVGTGSGDATMSGGDYARTTFSGTGWQQCFRTIGLPNVPDAEVAGAYRIYAAVRGNNAGDVFNLRWNALPTGVYGPATPHVATGGRAVLDLGVMELPRTMSVTEWWGPPQQVGGVSTYFDAQRVSGSGTLDWDYLLGMPADEEFVSFVTLADPTDGPGLLTRLAEIDGTARLWLAADVFGVDTVIDSAPASPKGKVPMLAPGSGVTTALVVLNGFVITRTTEITVAYYPRYLYT